MASAGRVLPIHKGTWVSGNGAYVPMDSVYHEGSTYICKDAVTSSVTPPDQDTAHWQIQAKGFSAPIVQTVTEDAEKVPSSKAVFNAIKADALKVTDKSGIIDGTVNKETSLQAMLDASGNWIATKGVAKDNLVTELFEVVHTWA